MCEMRLNPKELHPCKIKRLEFFLVKKYVVAIKIQKYSALMIGIRGSPASQCTRKRVDKLFKIVHSFFPKLTLVGRARLFSGVAGVQPPT